MKNNLKNILFPTIFALLFFAFPRFAHAAELHINCCGDTFFNETDHPWNIYVDASDATNYGITNGPSDNYILWSSTRDSVPVEDRCYNGYRLDSSGNSSLIVGSAWQSGDISENWIKTVEFTANLPSPNSCGNTPTSPDIASTNLRVRPHVVVTFDAKMDNGTGEFSLNNSAIHYNYSSPLTQWHNEDIQSGFTRNLLQQWWSASFPAPPQSFPYAGYMPGGYNNAALVGITDQAGNNIWVGGIVSNKYINAGSDAFNGHYRNTRIKVLSNQPSLGGTYRITPSSSVTSGSPALPSSTGSNVLGATYYGMTANTTYTITYTPGAGETITGITTQVCGGGFSTENCNAPSITSGASTSQLQNYGGLIIFTLNIGILSPILTIASTNPSSGISMTVLPADNSGQSNGSTQFTRIYNVGTPVSITAPSSIPGSNFSSWAGCDSVTGTFTCNVTMNASRTVTANYTFTSAETVRLHVRSTNPISGISMTVSPADNSGQSNGSTEFTRTYNSGLVVTVTAPTTNARGDPFLNWSGDLACSGGQTSTTCSVTVFPRWWWFWVFIDRYIYANYQMPPLGVTLTANPDSGPAPLDSSLSALVSGGRDGDQLDYSFWWNCSNTSNNVSTVSSACGNLPVAFPGSCNFNNVGWKCLNVNGIRQDTLPHTYSPVGTYTGKVIVGQVGITPAEARVPITVTATNQPPSVSNVTVTEPDYCASGPAATVTWTYSDPEGQPQSAYQVQVDDQGSFNSPEVDSGKVLSGGTSYFANNLPFDKTLKARVRVWDSADTVSDWTESGSWKTPKHAYPDVDFIWLPAKPSINQSVSFTDQTQFFDDEEDDDHDWNWLFKAPALAPSSTFQNPSYTYADAGLYNVNLAATDKDGYACSLAKPINIDRLIPTWKEVSPK